MNRRMRLRKIAQIIIYLRRVAIAKVLAELKDEDTTYLELVWVTAADMLPRSVQAGNGLNLRVVIPAYRKIRREGILSQTFRRK